LISFHCRISQLPLPKSRGAKILAAWRRNCQDRKGIWVYKNLRGPWQVGPVACCPPARFEPRDLQAQPVIGGRYSQNRQARGVIRAGKDLPELETVQGIVHLGGWPAVLAPLSWGGSKGIRLFQHVSHLSFYLFRILAGFHTLDGLFHGGTQI